MKDLGNLRMYVDKNWVRGLYIPANMINIIILPFSARV